MPQRQLIANNEVLSALPRVDFQRIFTQLETVELIEGQVLSEPDEPIRFIYFPITAIFTLLRSVDEDSFFAVGMAGRDGICNVTCALGSRLSPFRTLVQCPGRALRMKAKDFVDEFQACLSFRENVLKFVMSMSAQIAQTGACARHHDIEQRLARWLLMTRDRLSSDRFFMTHELLSCFLGVRRVGITTTARSLKERRLIDYSRGAIHILDADHLRSISCTCYSNLTSTSKK
jgi:CRP-like cAMP-binding protein